LNASLQSSHERLYGKTKPLEAAHYKLAIAHRAYTIRMRRWVSLVVIESWTFLWP
jgi:hypothetical protein